VISLDAIAASPATAADLAPEQRRQLMLRGVVALAALAAAPEASAMNADSDQYLDAREVAVLLRVTEAHVYHLIKSGELPAIAFGKYRRVKLADFRAWAARQRLDVPDYATYSPAHDGRRRAAHPQAPRGHATRTRGAGRRGTEQRGAVGARRDGGARVGGAADGAPGEAETAEAAEDLTDGVHS